MPKQPVKTSYQKLITDLEALYLNARKTVATMYWQMGQRIVEAEQDGRGRAPYGKKLIAGLAKDLTARLGSGFSKSNLERMRRVYSENRIAPPAVQLPWSHQVELLAVKDPKRRQMIAKKVVQENLDRDSVRRIVKAEKKTQQRLGLRATPVSASPAPNPVVLKVTRGRLSTVSRVAASRVINTPRGTVTLNLGFDLWRQVSLAEAKGMTITDKPEYTYSARVEKIIDGDTLWAQIDCGFGIVARQKLRFQGIDTPELDTPEGRRAKNFVAKRIPAGALIVVYTHKSDKYDRYLADIFYLPGCSDAARILNKGVFLNQELLNTNHARVWAT